MAGHTAGLHLVTVRRWRLLTALLIASVLTVAGIPVLGAWSASGAELPPVAGLLSRWHAADLALADGAPVAIWADSVGGVTVSQQSPTRQPTYQANVASLGGQPAVSFSRATGQWLTAASSDGSVPPGYLSGVSGVTVFVVMTTKPTISGAMTSFFASTGTSGTAARVLTQVTSGSQAGIASRRLDTDALVSVNSPASAVGGGRAYVLTGLLDLTGNQGRQYVNGQWALAKALSGAGVMSATGSQRVAIGVNGSDANAMDGAIAELLVYRSALTPSERAQVHSYIQDTYGIAVTDYVGVPTPTTTTTTSASTSSTPTTTTTDPSTETTTSTTTSATGTTTTSPSSTATAPSGPMPAKVAAPTLFAQPTALPASTTAAALVTATDATGAPVPGALVFAKFQATAGGGSASVGQVSLSSAYQPFVADSAGQLWVYYTTPPVLPRGGRDVFSVANLKSSATSTDTTTYSFTTTSHWRWLPEPISGPGSLTPGSVVPVAVTALDAAWLPVPNAQVCISLTQATGGGSATVSGVALTSKYQCFQADSAGTTQLDYRTPDTLPTTGMDQLNVRDTTSSLYNTSSFHGYSFGQLTQITMSPNPIAAPGTLAPGAKVSVTLTPRDATGAQVAGATVELWLETTSGAKATVSNAAAAPEGTVLGVDPKSFTSHTKTKLVVTYQRPKTPPASGTDLLCARVRSADGTVTSLTTAEYSWAG